MNTGTNERRNKLKSRDSCPPFSDSQVLALEREQALQQSHFNQVSAVDSVVPHIHILRCPNTGTSLRLMNSQELDRLNDLIANGSVLHTGGQRVELQIAGALANATGEFVYPVTNGIICFLPHLAIATTEQSVCKVEARTKNAAKIVSEFYDEFGWQKSEDGNFCDAAVFEDLRPVSQDYIHKCHLRLNDYISPGKYILDVASGPIQYDEYLTYSEQFDHRICIDISIVALREARIRVGSKGVFILGDITNIPLAENTVDCALSLHTIYHVDKDLQEKAFCELYRVVKPGRDALIVYTWGYHCALMNVLNFPAALTTLLRIAFKSMRSRKVVKSSHHELYYHPHGPRWFASRHWSFKPQIRVWRTVSVTFLKTYMHELLLGRLMLRLIYAFENRFPEFAGRFGQYPLFILHKTK